MYAEYLKQLIRDKSFLHYPIDHSGSNNDGKEQINFLRNSDYKKSITKL